MTAEFFNSREGSGNHGTHTWFVVISPHVTTGRVGTLAEVVNSGGLLDFAPSSPAPANYDQAWAVVAKACGLAGSPFGAIPSHIASTLFA